MGKVTRKRYSADFKSKVALEAIKGERTLAELTAKNTGSIRDRPIAGGTCFFKGCLCSLGLDQRRKMIEPRHPRLPIVRQCELLTLNRSSVYYRPEPESLFNLTLMRLIDEAFMECPFYGSRQMVRHLWRQDHKVGRKRVSGLMAKMGLSPIYQKPKTTVPHPEHKVYPYLQRDLVIDHPNQAWCADITCIPMRRGFLYLVAIMDWHSRKVLSWRLSNTMHADFCVEALEEALARYGKPDIFNTGQGSQFTGAEFTGVLKDAGVKISMDGRGHWMDNVFIERLWRSIKYECIYLHAFETGSELRQGLAKWISFYNTRRPHSVFSGQTPDEVYFQIATSPSPAPPLDGIIVQIHDPGDFRFRCGEKTYLDQAAS